MTNETVAEQIAGDAPSASEMKTRSERFAEAADAIRSLALRSEFAGEKQVRAVLLTFANELDVEALKAGMTAETMKGTL